ncbi:hypothetical protein [Nocardia farcinica]|uniref:hypothetical protein n=1 Tax=Nocardia farcinica TaxID=37329 RepID=UPI002454B64C|nr:hypothetical protein [Nocardia farcinica]
MAGRKRHSAEEIVRKLRRADELAAAGASGEEGCVHEDGVRTGPERTGRRVVAAAPGDDYTEIAPST